VRDFSEWEKQPINLKKQKDGVWKATVPLLPGSHQCKFLVDVQWQDNPPCAARVPNPFGAENCVRNVEY
jgi:1,4-alpha-glucan branching enzyme